MEHVQLREALAEVMSLATEVNKYLDVHAPWFEIKTNKSEAAKSVYTAIQAIDWLKLMFAPFIPHISEGLNMILGYTQPIFGGLNTQSVTDELGTHTVLQYQPENCMAKEGTDLWQPMHFEAGKPFNQPVPLVKKLDIAIVEEERAKLGQ